MIAPYYRIGVFGTQRPGCAGGASLSSGPHRLPVGHVLRATVAAGALMGGLLAALAAPGIAAAPFRSEPADLDVTLAITVASPVVVGSGTATGRLQVALLDREGLQIATGLTSSSVGVRWRVTLHDAAGELIGPWPGQQLRVSSNAGSVTVPVPDVAVRFDRLQNAVSGNASPDAQIRFLYGTDRMGRAEGTTGSDGQFAFSFPEGPPLRGSAPVTITLTAAGGHQTTFLRPVPYTVLSLHPGDVNGGLRPGSPVRVGLFDADRRYIAGGQSFADERGRFATWLRNGSGDLVRAQAGQVLRVADSDQSFEIAVPDLTGEYDLDRNLLHGTGVPGQPVSLVVWNPYFPEYAQPVATVDASGRWQIDPGIPLHPASHFYVTQELASGHQIFYCLQIPALHIQPGSPRVMVEALWDISADITLERLGEQVARASGLAGFEGRLPLTLRSPSNAAVAALPGDRIVALLDGVTRSLPIGVLSASLTAENMLVGMAPPGAEVVFDSRKPLERVSVGASGRFAFDAAGLATDGWARSGETFEVYTLAETGDHVRVSFTGPALAVGLQSEAVAGSAMPAVAFRLRRVSTGGLEESAEGRTSADGSFQVALAGPVAPGDDLTFETGPVSATLTVPAIDATFDPDSGLLAGTGPPFELLDVEAFVLQASFPHRLFVTTDAQGRWSEYLGARTRGQPVVDPFKFSGFRIRYLDNANSVAVRLSGPFPHQRHIVALPAIRRP